MSVIDISRAESSRNSRLLGAAIVAVCLFLYILTYFQSASLPVQRQPQTPVRLVIPSIHVDAEIQPVGLLENGSMGVPTGPDTTGWLDTSASLGTAGTMLIDGHRGWKDRIHAVFDDLHTLQAGNLIYVKATNGEHETFVVQNIRVYTTGEDVSLVFASSSVSRLNLITCDGDWDTIYHTYSRRVVVFATKILVI